ncbi:MAG: DUF167 domain-containing protein [Planctomycetota bacterium]|nr:DUF167 domain-containing protein [Planctomycetota bacterium]
MDGPDGAPFARLDADGAITLQLKVVPGARRDEIAGVLGDRLKIRVSAPPEGGKANKAVCRLIATRLGVRVADIEIVAGHSSPEKSVQIRGLGLREAVERLG